jgi:hypothetical protein
MAEKRLKFEQNRGKNALFGACGEVFANGCTFLKPEKNSKGPGLKAPQIWPLPEG